MRKRCFSVYCFVLSIDPTEWHKLERSDMTGLDSSNSAATKSDLHARLPGQGIRGLQEVFWIL
jgi:hypothetical protein